MFEVLVGLAVASFALLVYLDFPYLKDFANEDF